MKKITAIVVVYKEIPAQTKIVQSLIELCNHSEKINSFIQDVDFLIYDNSPQEHESISLKNYFLNLIYVHDERNLGLSNAYNSGLNYAKERHDDYLWLFDQDTALNTDYINELIDVLTSETENAIAIVPRIVSNQILVSPRNILSPYRVRKLNVGLQSNVLAINSSSLIRVDFLYSIGGFSQTFKLDFLDNWLFYKIHQAGYRVYVMQSIIHHSLSVLDTRSIDMQRYKSIIDSEKLYYTEYQKIGWFRYTSHIILRIMSQVVLKHDIEKAKLLIKYCLFNNDK